MRCARFLYDPPTRINCLWCLGCLRFWQLSKGSAHGVNNCVALKGGFGSQGGLVLKTYGNGGFLFSKGIPSFSPIHLQLAPKVLQTSQHYRSSGLLGTLHCMHAHTCHAGCANMGSSLNGCCFKCAECFPSHTANLCCYAFLCWLCTIHRKRINPPRHALEQKKWKEEVPPPPPGPTPPPLPLFQCR